MPTIISYADPNGGTEYSLTLVNNSNRPWTFFVYQQVPKPSNDQFSLAWFASPYKIRVGDYFKARWTINYNFVWGDTGVLQSGVIFDAGGVKPADPNGLNTVGFDLSSGPGFGDPTKGPPAGTLVINDGGNVPSSRFSVGIGMSGAGTFVVQADANLKHQFTPTPSYWIAAGDDMQVGTVLDIQTITQTIEARFPPSVFNLKGTLNADNTWTVGPA